MNKIESLIVELVPEGVEFKELGKVILKNTFKQLGASDLVSLKVKNGDIKLLPSSKNYNWWTNEEVAGDYICEGEIITLGRARYANLKYYKGKFVSSNNHIVISENPEKVLNRYLYYFISDNLEKFYIETSTYPKLDNKIFEKIRIPIPPLVIQKEIVKILDNFIELETKLETKLGVELESRKKQYKYCRDTLLTFGDEVKFRSIQALLDSKVISTVSPPKKLVKKYYQDVGNFPIVDQGQSFIVGYTNDESVIVDSDEYVIFGDHTEAIKYVDFAFAQGADGIKILKTNGIIPKYFYYSLNNFYVKTGKYTRHFSFLKKTLIPIPPLSEQKRIVSILDKFDALTNDISIGLPAELTARRKQYEHYRSKLLTFKEKEYVQ